MGPLLFNTNNVEQMKFIYILSYTPIVLSIILAELFCHNGIIIKGTTKIYKCEIYLHYHFSSMSLFSSQFSLVSEKDTMA